MTDAPDRDQKTEAATPKRRREAAEKGDLLQSRELATALVMAAGALWLVVAGPAAVGSIETMLIDGLTFNASDLRDFRPGDTAFRLIAAVALPIALLFAMTLVAAIASSAMLGSLGFRPQAFAPRADRLNPLAGMRRMFGVHGLIELAKSLAKVALLGGVCLWIVTTSFSRISGLSSADPRTAAEAFGSSFVLVVAILTAALGAIAMVDVPSQLLQRLSRLRMSKQEVKDEAKETEGSPELKAAVRRRQHEVLRASARSAIAEATVVLANPTHFAVALRYRPGIDAVPVVMARGRGATALAIRALATEKQVPVLTYPQLARAVYFTTRTGHPIREDLYVAVATVLAFVFNLDAVLANGGAQPDIEVPAGARFDSDGKPQV
jgi:flagellar biosynthetic protein FlhB